MLLFCCPVHYTSFPLCYLLFPFSEDADTEKGRKSFLKRDCTRLLRKPPCILPFTPSHLSHFTRISFDGNDSDVHNTPELLRTVFFPSGESERERAATKRVGSFRGGEMVDGRRTLDGCSRLSPGFLRLSLLRQSGQSPGCVRRGKPRCCHPSQSRRCAQKALACASTHGRAPFATRGERGESGD